MTDNKVSENLCTERSGNILDKITSLDDKLEKWMHNHAIHMQKDMKDAQTDIKKINKKLYEVFNKFENEEILRKEKNKNKKKFDNTIKILLPILVGIGMKLVEYACIYWGII